MQNDENLTQQAIKNLKAVLKENEDLQYQCDLLYKACKDFEAKLQEAKAEIEFLKTKKPLPKAVYHFNIN